ncbi:MULTISPECIES: DUF2487 family protein [Bacillaceae]|uniref:DUF2487 family protein n=1 Tax=Metabacillus sediminis TaxID=3117746 RepID=A0ABZ2NC59_9BACI|nr:DUF2487 family protein [Bacillus sp. SJS]KZZ86398.1 hypothetical protein AS29_000265 [Bacillus sp. SJS]
MKWAANDALALEKEKQYIDTLVVPLIPAGLAPSMLENIQAGEFAMLLSEELERQLRGRIMLSPPFTYLPQEEHALIRLMEWKKDAEADFKHIVFLTTDSIWKTAGGDLQKNVIWIPSIPLQNLDREVTGQLLESHLQQIMNILLQFWNCK